MHFTCSICTATSWDQVIFKEVSPHEEKKTSVDFWKDHLYVKFPQCLPGGNRRIGKFGWTARSTGERKSTILSLQTGLSGIKCRPLSEAWSGSRQLWSKGVGETSFPPSAYLFVFVIKTLHYCTSSTDNVPWRCKSVSLAHLTDLYKTEMLAEVLKKVGNEWKLSRICPTVIFNLHFLPSLCPSQWCFLSSSFWFNSHDRSPQLPFSHIYSKT